MPVNRKGFSLLEVLIAMTISSILLLSTSRFLPGLQRGVLLQSGQQELEDEVWQRLFAIGKQFQRAGYCAGHCQGQGMIIGRQGRCAIVLWDANSNGQWIAPRQKTTVRDSGLSPDRLKRCGAPHPVTVRDGISSPTRIGS